jgi:hypothetical protein
MMREPYVRTWALDGQKPDLSICNGGSLCLRDIEAPKATLDTHNQFEAYFELVRISGESAPESLGDFRRMMKRVAAQAADGLDDTSCEESTVEQARRVLEMLAILI